MAGGGGGDGEPEMQVAPLIDVLLVMLIFFMSITTSQTLKVDAAIQLPVTPAGEKPDNKATGIGLINISWDEAGPKAKFKLDDREITDTDAEEPSVKGLGPLIKELEKRKGSNPKFRLLVRADKKVQAKFINKALQWGANAGIDNISFSGLNQ